MGLAIAQCPANGVCFSTNKWRLNQEMTVTRKERGSPTRLVETRRLLKTKLACVLGDGETERDKKEGDILRKVQ